MTSAPEFKHHPKFNEVGGSNVYIVGGTAFVGTPTVFHHPAIRQWHDETTRRLMPFVQELAELSGIPNVKLARWLFDRVQIRAPNLSAGGENFHIDMPGMVEPEPEMCIGGFLNCDDAPQYFCGIKESHSRDPPKEKGFAKIDKAGQAACEAKLLAQANQHDTDSKGRIIVPPQTLILFFTNIQHKVNPSKVPYTSVKIFYGFRLTAATNSGMVGRDKKRLSYETIETMMKDNAVMPLGSGQTPAFYPGMYHVIPKLLPKAKDVVETMLVDGAMEYPFDKANAAHDYTRATKSLRAMGVPLHAPYRQDEFDALRPQSDVRIYNHATGEVDTFPLKRARVD